MNKFKILLIDDLETNLYLLDTLISEYFEDVEIIQTLSAKEALKIVLETNIDLVFSDVQMPDMDGFEFTQILKSYKKTIHIPVILITALSLDKKYQIKGYQAGAVDYITKPIDKEILIPKIRNFKKIFELQKKMQEQNEEIQFSLRNQTMSVLIFLDLDSFKHINDSLGHDYGDKVLQSIAKTLTDSIRDFDIASRIGGDEFLVLLRGDEADKKSFYYS